ncbi:hypothetical protein LCGC14_3048800 [marine sediment metagenome]|uniref:DUF4878 domain-containing protein n=1 Tax=marine sediment metagenome TaxID=412755 RepID=A0A0F8WMU1_9ZZZZ
MKKLITMLTVLAFFFFVGLMGCSNSMSPGETTKNFINLIFSNNLLDAYTYLSPSDKENYSPKEFVGLMTDPTTLQGFEFNIDIIIDSVQIKSMDSIIVCITHSKVSHKTSRIFEAPRQTHVQLVKFGDKWFISLKPWN